MITFERTIDKDAVRKILTDKRAYCYMVNDSAPKRDDFDVAKGDYIPVLAKVDGKPVAVFLLFPKSPGTAEVHFCFIPELWGATKPLAEAFLVWVWGATSLFVLVGKIPAYNSLARKLALSVGFTLRGTEPGKALKYGKPFDLMVTEARRPNAFI